MLADGTLGLADVPESLARIHVDFERLHPFIDGNGRTGRLLLNLMLTRLGWPPIVIFKEQRGRYLNALDRADHDDLGPLAELIVRARRRQPAPAHPQHRGTGEVRAA